MSIFRIWKGNVEVFAMGDEGGELPVRLSAKEDGI